MLTKRGISLALSVALASAGCGARQTREAGSVTVAAGSSLTCMGFTMVATGCATETDEYGNEYTTCEGTTNDADVRKAGAASMGVGGVLMIVGGVLVAAGTPRATKPARRRPRSPAPATTGFLY